MNNAISIEAAADAWLCEWARWASGDARALGYPERWVTERAKEGGLRAGSPIPPVSMPPEVELTDLAVAKFRMKNRSILWLTIKVKYREHAPIEALMWRLHVSRSQAYRLLGRAQRAVYLERAAIA